MNIERNFQATLWRHRWRHHHKKLFWHHLGRSFHIWGQIESVFNISKFSKWPPFWARQTFFKGSYTGTEEYTRKIAMSISDIFELLIDAVTQILTEIYQFQNCTYFVTWWRHQWGREYLLTIYNCSYNLMIHMQRKFNEDIFARCLVIMKNVVISYIKEYRGPTLRPPYDVIDDVIIIKILFIWHHLGRSFPIWGQI